MWFYNPLLFTYFRSEFIYLLHSAVSWPKKLSSGYVCCFVPGWPACCLIPGTNVYLPHGPPYLASSVQLSWVAFCCHLSRRMLYGFNVHSFLFPGLRVALVIYLGVIGFSLSSEMPFDCHRGFACRCYF